MGDDEAGESDHDQEVDGARAVVVDESPLQPRELDGLVDRPAAGDREDPENRHREVGAALQSVVLGAHGRVRPGTPQDLRRQDSRVVPHHPERLGNVGEPRQERLVPIAESEAQDIEKAVAHEEIREEPVEAQRLRQMERADADALVD